MLSATQHAAVTSDAARPLQILAGPGSGKTRVLTSRVAHLVRDSAAPIAPERCVVVTFTNRAANEMRATPAATGGSTTATPASAISP